MISNKFKTISILKRRIKDQYSYNDFRQEWLPELAGQYNIPTYVITALKTSDEKEIISIALIAADLERIMEEARRTMKLDIKRKNKIIEVADSHGNAELYTIKNIDNLHHQKITIFGISIPVWLALIFLTLTVLIFLILN